jgi:hypothetical protein
MPKYVDALKIFKNSTSLRLVLNEENTEAIHKYFHYTYSVPDHPLGRVGSRLRALLV